MVPMNSESLPLNGSLRFVMSLHRLDQSNFVIYRFVVFSMTYKGVSYVSGI